MEETTTVRPRTRWRALAFIGTFSVLLAQFIVWAGPAPAQVTGNVLYGADGAGTNEATTLYTINPADGTKIATIGLIGFAVTGLAVDPTTGQMYGSTTSFDDALTSLIKIDKTTGEGSLIGEILPGCDRGINDLTFTTDGQLWGWTRFCDPDHVLVKIDKATGEGTTVGTGLASSFGNGLSADPDDNTLWLTPDGDDGDYGTVDKTTGAFTNEGVLDGDNSNSINSLAWSCDGETLYGTANIDSSGGVREFIVIDTATDEITVAGGPAGIDPQQDALAWDCAPPPPVTVAKCKGLAATIVGTGGNDTLIGTSGRDVVAARGGKDRIAGLGGNDVVCAGAGRDRANGGACKDKLRGQGGNDRLRGAGGKDNLRGGGGHDRCNGGPGNDTGRCEVERSMS